MPAGGLVRRRLLVAMGHRSPRHGTDSRAPEAGAVGKWRWETGVSRWPSSRRSKPAQAERPVAGVRGATRGFRARPPPHAIRPKLNRRGELTRSHDAAVVRARDSDQTKHRLRSENAVATEYPAEGSPMAETETVTAHAATPLPSGVPQQGEERRILRGVVGPRGR